MQNNGDTSRQDELINEFGSYFESLGFQPIAGRIVGLLSVSDKESLSFDEITTTLCISKGSASTMLRKLAEKGTIKCVTSEGDRRRYYQINGQNLFKLIDDFERKCNMVHNLLNKAYELKTDKMSENAVFFQKIIRTLDFYKRNISDLKNELTNE